MTGDAGSSRPLWQGRSCKRMLGLAVSSLAMSFAQVAAQTTDAASGQEATTSQSGDSAPDTTQGPAGAPVPAGPSGTGRESAASLADIIVTGQKRASSTVDVPATVSVLSTEALKTNQVFDLQGLATVVAGFSYERAAGANLTATIRGIGTAPGATSLEQSVAPYIDGVYQAGTQRGYAWPIFDLARVEVYKGTQSGIVGQNTSSGVVSMVTNNPSDRFGGFVDGLYEFNNGGYALEGAVDVPVSETFQIRFSGVQRKVGGWAPNRATGNDLSTQFLTGGRIKAVWEPSSDLKIEFFGEYDRLKNRGPVVSYVFDDPTGGYAAAISPFFVFDPGKVQVAYSDRRGRANGDDVTKSDNLRGSVKIDWNIGGGYTLTSITAASRENDFLQVDQDYTPAVSPPPTPTSQISQALQQVYDYSQITEELRLASPTDARFNYIVGAWYRHAETERTFTFFRDRFGANDVATMPYSQRISNGSIFGDAQFDITDTLKIGGSLRYTKETKRSTSAVISNWPALYLNLASTKVKLTPSFLDGSARIEYHPSRAFNIYAGYAHGTKTGAVPDIVGSGIIQILKPEKAETYEIGAKGALFDSLLTYEISLFEMNISGFQDVSTQVVNGLTVFFASNSDVQTKGVDLSLRARPVQGLDLGLSAEHLDAYNKSFRGEHVRSPKWAFVADARYTFFDLPFSGSLSLFGSMQYKSSYFTVPANVTSVFGPTAIPTRIATKSPEFTKINIGVEYALNENYKVTLTCRNCTNEREYTRVIAASMFGAPVRYGYLNELRTISLGLRANF